MVEFDLPARAAPVGITLLHVADCPHLSLARDRVVEAAERAGVGVRLEERLVHGLSDAAELGFTGSPTILVDGVDPFADTDLVPSLACRLYGTDEGVQGAPGVDALVRVLRRSRGTTLIRRSEPVTSPLDGPTGEAGPRRGRPDGARPGGAAST